MPKQIFINLAVHNVNQSADFYTALGFTENPQFSDGENKCMMWSDSIYLMLLNHKKFGSFVQKPIADSKTTTAAIYSLSFDTLEEMNNTMEKGKNAGGQEINEAIDYGFMIQRSIEDADGYLWELFYMDMSKIPQQ